MLAEPLPIWDDTVSLRPLRADDADAITRQCQDPEISRWTLVPRPYERRDAEEFLASGTWSLAVCDPRDGALVGCIGVPDHDEATGVCEMGYWIGRDVRRRGLATAAVRLLGTWLVSDGGCNRVELLIMPANTASQGVAAKAGFVNEGRVRGRRIEDAVLWSLSASEV